MVTPARPRPRRARPEPGRSPSDRLRSGGRVALTGGDPPHAAPPHPDARGGTRFGPPAARDAYAGGTAARSGGPTLRGVPLVPFAARAYGPSEAGRTAARRRLEHRRRRAAVLAVLLAAASLVLADVVRGDLARERALTNAAREPAAEAPAARDPAASGTRSTAGPSARARPGDAGRPEKAVPRQSPAESRLLRPTIPEAREASSPPAPGQPEVPVAFPVTGPGTFAYAGAGGQVFGRAGPLRRYRVAVEQGTGQRVADFAAAVDAVFGDRRGWTASGRLRLRRVARDESANFIVFLATPGTSERMCAAGGLRTERFTSCRLSGRVVINLARWWLAVPGYRASLAEYRAYAINHETGHELGRGHEGCPGAGRPAPVMQQQTLGLHGCVANGWPYVDGHHHVGPPVP